MVESRGMHLIRTEENLAAIDALAAALGGRVGVEAVLGDLDRKARRTWAPGLAVRRALTWDAADRRDPVWWPQGITTSEDTGVPGQVLVVSWYAKDEQGVRISFLDLERRRYRHVLLVEPTLVDGRPGLKPVRAHAGGLVWHRPYLHVAATGRGFLSFRMDDVLRLPDDAPPELVGTLAGRAGYRYLLPLRFAYRAVTEQGVERLRYSFISLDRSDDPPSLVAGEYGSSRQTRRFAHFPTDPHSGLLAAGEDGISHPAVLDEGGMVRTQGVVIARGVYHLTASHGPWLPGTVHVGRPGRFRAHRWATPMGPEDLVWWRSTDLLWSVSEHPRRRWVFAMPRSRFS